LSTAIVLLASALVQGGLSLSSAKTQSDALEQQREEILRTMNGNIQEVRKQGNLEIFKQQFRNKIYQGQNIVRTAASGVNMTGSALDVDMQNFRMGLTDENIIQENTNSKIDAMYGQAISNTRTLTNKQIQVGNDAFANILNIGAQTASGIYINKQEGALQNTIQGNALTRQRANQANLTQNLDALNPLLKTPNTSINTGPSLQYISNP